MALSIHRYTTAGPASVNTYWLETAQSVIVIDGQRELSKAKAALAEIQSSGKPIAAVFLTHPHPDHFGGIGVFSPEGSSIPLYGSQVTRDSIREDRFDLVKKSREAIGDDFPETLRLPDNILTDGQDVVIDDLRLIAYEFGAGEAETMTVLYLPEEKALFTADLIQHHMTAYLLEGRSGEWLLQLERLISRFPEDCTAYPGHGQPGSLPDLVQDQREYLETFRHLVKNGLGETDPGRLADQVRREVERRYPGYMPVAAIPTLLEMNVGTVKDELQSTADEK